MIAEIACCHDQARRRSIPKLEFEFREFLAMLSTGDCAVIEVDLDACAVTVDQPARPSHVGMNDRLERAALVPGEERMDRMAREAPDVRFLGMYLGLQLLARDKADAVGCGLHGLNELAVDAPHTQR